MLMNDPVGEVLAWLLFSLVLIWALRQGVPEFSHWLAHNADGHEDIYFFPDEVRGEPGPGSVAWSEGAVNPRDERGRQGEPKSGRS